MPDEIREWCEEHESVEVRITFEQSSFFIEMIYMAAGISPWETPRVKARISYDAYSKVSNKTIFMKAYLDDMYSLLLLEEKD